MTTTEDDTGDTHTYALVSGTGDTDNASFTIAGDELKAAEAFDLETKASYDIRIQTDDGRGGTFEKAFTITIDNVPEADLRITGNNDIPATPLGITTTFDITIHNDGDATLTVGSILYPTAFGGPVSGITVAPASSEVVTMTFTPSVAQLYTGDITINTNGGTGVLTVSADGAIITGLDDGLLKAEAIKLYPNPATDIVTIDLSKYNGRALDIQLYNMSGIKTFDINQYKEAILKLDVSGYHNGLYLVQFTDGKSTVQKKIMIRK
ncbi:MAG: T9SS type A sorting domain-containing protein [Roseivirga sp.]|nr:T9SS type A sorting domain-containing protein [Roseivirga sp.]